MAALLSSTQAQTHAAPPSPLSIGYVVSTDLFNLLDNLADWLPGYTAAVYRSYWEEHVGLDDEDRALLAAYAAFRQRTSPLAKDDPVAVADRIFAADSTRDPDPFSRHFLDASSFDAAAEAAINTQSAADQGMLRGYYARFLPRATRVLAVQPRFDAQQKRIADELSDPRIARLANQIRAFFDVSQPPDFQARFVWWPQSDQTQAKVRGRSILLYSQHDAEAGAMDWTPILVHELSHYLSAGQPEARKQALAAKFLQLCPAAAVLRNPLNALEEPLAIYWGQYRFEHAVRGKQLPATNDWYIQPDADRGAKALAVAFPATAAAPVSVDSAVLAAVASACPPP